MKKYTKKQLEKVGTIKAYLAQMESHNYLLISSSSTNVYNVKNIFKNAASVFIIGTDIHGGRVKESLWPSEISEVFRQCMKDEDFANFIQKN